MHGVSADAALQGWNPESSGLVPTGREPSLTLSRSGGLGYVQVHRTKSLGPTRLGFQPPIRGHGGKLAGAPAAEASGEAGMEITETTPQQMNRLTIGGEREPIRELFELLACYIATAAGAYGVVVWSGRLATTLLPTLAQYPKSFLVCLAVSFVVLLAASNSWLRTAKGQPIRSAIATWAYPIILAAGLWGGYRYSEYDFPRTEQGRQYEAALSACMEQPMCIRRMQRKDY